MPPFNFLPAVDSLFGEQGYPWGQRYNYSTSIPYKTTDFATIYSNIYVGNDPTTAIEPYTGRLRGEMVKDSVASSRESQEFRESRLAQYNRTTGIFGSEMTLWQDPFGAGQPARGGYAAMGSGGAGSAIVPYGGGMGAGGYAVSPYSGSGAQDDPRRLLDDFATALKEKLNPAMRESIETIKQLPSRAGGAGRGGFDGGGSGGFGGSFGGGDWVEGEWSEMPQRRGWGARFGDFARNLGSDVGNMLQNPDALSFNVWKASMSWRTFGGSPLAAADAYQQQQASQESMLMGAGISDYSDLMGGMYGNIARRRGRGAEFQYQYGQQASAAMSGIMDIMGGPQGGGGILGTMMALGGPAVGAGLAAGALSGGNPYVAAGVGLGTLGIGTLGYVSTNMQNYYGMGQAALNNPLQAWANNPGGAAGVVGNWLTGNVGDAKVQQSPFFATAVNQFAQGGVDLSQIREQFPNLISAFSDADIFGQGVDTQLGNLNTNYGIDRERGMGILSRYTRFNRSRLPTTSEVTRTIEAQSMGFDSVAMAQQRVSAFGGNQYNLSQLSSMTDAVENRITGAYDPLASGQTIAGETAIGGAFNALYSAAGLPLMNPNQAQRMVGLSDFQRANVLSVTGQMTRQMAGGSEFYQQPGMAGFLDMTQQVTEMGAPQVARRFQSQLGRYEGIYRRAGMFGGDQSAVMGRAFNAATMGEGQSDLDYATQTGDRYAQSANWQQLGDSRYNTIDMTSGLPINEMRMRGLQDEQRGISRGLDTTQFISSNYARNMGFQMQAGGAGIGAGGFAVGGDGLAGLAGIFAAQGMGFNAGNGMGMWQVQDAFTMLQRRQQQSGIDMSGQGNDIARRRFELSSNYQEQNMNINRQQQLTMFDWQATGMSMDRNRAELSHGFQMEDYDRNIRFATGRQRMDLMRQQERASIFFSMDQTQRGAQEEQFETQKGWAKDEFDRKKEYFDESKKLSLEELDLTKRRFEETKKNLQEQWGLEDQRRLLDRQNEQAQFQMATNLASASREASLKLNDIADRLLFISRLDMDNLAWINLQVNTGNVGGGSGGGYAPGAGGSGGSGLPVPLPPPPPPPNRGGGGRNIPTPNIAAAASDSGMNGYLIQMVKLLEIIAAYGPMRMNTTVYSNDSVKTNDLYQRSKAKVQ